jgi:AcrR family transcriptional regulator
LVLTTPARAGEPTGARARQRDETRSRLMRAAKGVFEERGYHEARISDIAERAGVSHGLLYHYFDSKEDLIRELAVTVDQDLQSSDVILDRTSNSSPAERLHDAIQRHLDRYRHHAAMLRVIDEVARYDPGVNAVRQELLDNERRRVVHAIRQLQRRGLADRRLDPDLAARAISGITRSIADDSLHHGRTQADFRRSVDQCTLLVMNALGAHGHG